MTRKTCSTCRRGPQSFDGCSHVDCPNRIAITAQLVGEPFLTAARGVEGKVIVAGGVRQYSNVKDHE